MTRSVATPKDRLRVLYLSWRDRENPEAGGAETFTERTSEVLTDLGYFIAMSTFALAIGLVVGTFIIYNTFSMIVAQRNRELALLRAVGATERQVSRSVLFEAFVVGVFGGVVGLG